MFPCLFQLDIAFYPKLQLSCLPYVKNLYVNECNNELLRSISSFYGLTSLDLERSEGITSFPKGMFRNLTCLEYLRVSGFRKLKELPNEPFSLALEHLNISCCSELEPLPEEIWGGLQSLRKITIGGCERLKCLLEGIRHLTSLDLLTIFGCPILKERCKEGTGENWDKIAHIREVSIFCFWKLSIGIWRALI